MKTITGHPYSSPIDAPQPTRRPVWMSEWQPGGTTWDERWDDGGGYDGITVAGAINDPMTVGNVSAYISWPGASVGATRAFIQLDGDAYHVTKRLWAMAAYSRFIRPGAVRIGASTGLSGLKVTAYRNADRSLVLEVLNTATQDASADLSGLHAPHGATAHLTDESHSLAPTDAVGRGDGGGRSPLRSRRVR